MSKHSIRAPPSASKHQDVSFPEKLHALLEANAAPESMRWSAKGDAVCLFQKPFEESASLQHFQAIRFLSLTRRLRRNGFQRISRPEEGCNQVFRHIMFCKGGVKWLSFFRLDTRTQRELLLQEPNKSTPYLGEAALSIKSHQETPKPARASMQVASRPAPMPLLHSLAPAANAIALSCSLPALTAKPTSSSSLCTSLIGNYEKKFLSTCKALPASLSRQGDVGDGGRNLGWLYKLQGDMGLLGGSETIYGVSSWSSTIKLD